jgi:hypothetical protein
MSNHIKTPPYNYIAHGGLKDKEKNKIGVNGGVLLIKKGIDNTLSILVGKEEKYKQYSILGGKHDKSDIIPGTDTYVNTCIREFWEESGESFDKGSFENNYQKHKKGTSFLWYHKGNYALMILKIKEEISNKNALIDDLINLPATHSTQIKKPSLNAHSKEMTELIWMKLTPEFFLGNKPNDVYDLLWEITQTIGIFFLFNLFYNFYLKKN